MWKRVKHFRHPWTSREMQSSDPSWFSFCSAFPPKTIDLDTKTCFVSLTRLFFVNWTINCRTGKNMKKRYMILHFKSTVMNNWKVQKVRRLQPLHSHPETRIKEASRAKNMFNMILTRIWSENPLWLGICMKREWSEHPVQLENDNTPKTKTKSCKISRDFSTVLPIRNKY